MFGMNWNKSVFIDLRKEMRDVPVANCFITATIIIIVDYPNEN
jgi:hypothetical protein